MALGENDIVYTWGGFTGQIYIPVAAWIQHSLDGRTDQMPPDMRGRAVLRDRITVLPLPPIAHIGAGRQHAIVVARDGAVYNCLIWDSPGVAVPVRGLPPLDEDIVVATVGGWEYSVALTLSGRVFAWPNSTYGYLGAPYTPESEAAVPVPAGTTGLPDPAQDPVVSIAAGWRLTLALTRSGLVFAWTVIRPRWRSSEPREQAQLSYTAPVRVGGLPCPEDDPVVHIDAGDGRGLVLTESGRLFGWPTAERERANIAHSKSLSYDVPGLDWTFYPVSLKRALLDPSLERLTWVGGHGSYHLALSSSGRLFGWGGNFNGNQHTGGTGPLGHSAIPIGGRADEPVPITIEGLPTDASDPIASLALGNAHVLALTREGRLFAWGDNSRCQLGVQDKERRTHAIEVTLPTR